MNKLYLLLLTGLLYPVLSYAQPADLVLSSAESGTKLHQATNSITFAAGYSYTPNGGTMTAEIVGGGSNPPIAGDIVYLPAINPATYSINTNLAVGKTPGNLNAGGSAGYVLPIEVPQGTNGMQPSINLNYTSIFSDGLMGIGWNLGGISAISRVNETIYHNGKSDPVRGDFTDEYSLNGNRLIVVNGRHGFANSEYRTEMEEFSKVVVQANNSYGPDWFKVYTKSGLIYEFGNTADSKVTKGNGCVLSWKVNKITDRHNNYISFSYIADDDEHPISKIKYTGNSSLSKSPFAEIVFNYKYREDVNRYFYGGEEFVRDILLSHIEVINNGQTFRKYALSYMKDTHSQLLKVTETSSQNAALNPTVFAWTDQTEQFTQTIHYSNSANEFYFTGDFNGDGRADLVAVPEKTAYTSSDKWKLYLANSSGNLVYKTQGALNSSFEKFLVNDFNGDGLVDLMMQEKHPNSTYPNRKYYYYYQSTGSTFTRSSSYYASNDAATTDVVDYNGDGKLEFFFHDSSNNWWLYTYSGTAITNGSIPDFGQYYIVDNGMQTRILDFNGDGCSDLLTLFPNGFKLYEFKGTNGNLTQTDFGSYINNSDIIMFGDYNGDGTVDIFKADDRSSYLFRFILSSTGAGFNTRETFDFNQFDLNESNNRIFSRDMNGDGKSDIVLVGRGTNTGNSYNRINVALSTGNGFSITEHTASITMQYGSDNYFHVEDFNGDGRTQLFYKYGSTSRLFSFANGTPSHLLSTVIDGLGTKSTISYLPMTNSSVYTRGTGATYPLNDFSSGLQLVAQISSDNGIGGTTTMSYQYNGAKVHRQGKGFLGFSKITASNSATGIATENHYEFDATYYFSKLRYSYTKHGGTTLSTTDNSWNVTSFGNKRIFPYVSPAVETNNLTGHSTSTTAVYDNYGNLTTSAKNYNNGVTERVTNNYSNWLNTSSWLISRLGSTTTTFSRSGETSISQTVRFTYSSDGITKPDYVYYYEGSPLEYSKNHDYDNRGNLEQIYTSGTSFGSTQVNYTYGQNGVRLKTSKDVFGHTTTRYYDGYGRLSSEEDYLGNTTAYTYDNQNRIATVTQPNGFVSTTSYNWGLTGGPANACYYVQQSGNEGSLAKTWHDKLARKIRSDVRGFNGSYIYTVNEYNNKGQLYRVSEPGTTTSPSQWNTNTYDSFGRIDYIDRYSGQDTDYSYSSNRVTETTGGKTQWKEFDSQGLVTKAHDNGGDLVYSYYPDGKAKTITAPGSIVTSMEYTDAARNQTKLIDPSAGTINYTYNSLGLLKTQKNARNQTLTINYHADGRKINEIRPEGTTSYNYNSNKQLTEISSPGGVKRNFGYDNKGRVNNVTETIPGASVFSTTFTFDSKGRLKDRIHPSGITETNNYNSYGYLYSVSAGGATRYRITAMNQRQQITAATYGTGLNASFGFDSYGYPSSSKAKVGSSYRQDYRYSFNSVTGNLNLRQNYLRSKSESFDYDNVDRLTEVTGPQNLIMNYAANGNITTKSDVGSVFNYDHPTKPYALTGVKTSSGLIAGETQEATYTSFEQVSTIDEGDYHAEFTYNSDNQRAKMLVTDLGSTLLTRWYVGSRYLKETSGSTTKEYTWIGGDAYSAPVVAEKTGSTINYYYLLRDYLGNITHKVNSSNTVVAEYSYDVWGRRRDKDSWSYTLSGEPALLADRAFTSHEYLPWFKLYNMNGRLYDPVVGRFLSADPVIQNAGFTQNYNRYSYALNNPLKYIDPSGNEYFKYHDENERADGYNDPNLRRLREWRPGGASSSYFGSGGGPGYIGNGTGLGGVYYDWYSGAYRSTASGNPQVSWQYLYHVASPYSYETIYEGQAIYIGNNGYLSTSNGNIAVYAVTPVIGVYGTKNTANGGVWLNDAWNSTIGRMIVPDFLAIGVGFNGIVGVGGASSVEFRWVTHGPEASWKPMITVTQSIGGGYSVDATLNIESANYIGNVNNIRRRMMQTNTFTGDIPTIWGSAGVATGGKIGATGYITPNVGGSVIIGRELNLGVGLPAGPFPVNGAGGTSNTWILQDFYY